jgi:hypothetical protein
MGSPFVERRGLTTTGHPPPSTGGDSRGHSSTHTHTHDWLTSFGRSLKLLLVFASTIIPGFSLLEIHDQDFYLLDMYVFKNEASSSTTEGVGLSIHAPRLLHRSFSTSISALSRRPGHYELRASFVTTLFYVTFIRGIQRFPVNAGLCSRSCLNLCNYSETAVGQLNGRRPDRRQV